MSAHVRRLERRLWAVTVTSGLVAVVATILGAWALVSALQGVSAASAPTSVAWRALGAVVAVLVARTASRWCWLAIWTHRRFRKPLGRRDGRP